MEWCGLEGMVWILWVFRASYFTCPVIKIYETVARAINCEKNLPVGCLYNPKEEKAILSYLLLLGSNLLFASRVKCVQVSKGKLLKRSFSACRPCFDGAISFHYESKTIPQCFVVLSAEKIVSFPMFHRL